MLKVVGTHQFLNERSFAILLENENALVFKMHGTRANVLWSQGHSVHEIFRNNMEADLLLTLSELERNIDWSYEEFERRQSELPTTYYTLGKPVWKYLTHHGFDTMPLNQKWDLFKQTLNKLEKPTISIVNESESYFLSLLPSPSSLKSFDEPIHALNDFFIMRTSSDAFQREKTAQLSQVKKKLKQATSSEEKSLARLMELDGDNLYPQWADLIMANLTRIPQGVDKVELENFYNNQKSIVIKLKKELSPQKNAEVYYRKGKNQVIEIRKLKETIHHKQAEIIELTNLLHTIEEVSDLTHLKDSFANVQQKAPLAADKKALPFHEFDFRGFKIWVGRNAKANDELTLKYGFKEDLWLHAKDVAGSHVLIKYQSGKPFPKDVIEHAAALAAHYSKRKNESLCPVAYTQKKFVRKRKGDPAGTVVVEREEVILVTPSPQP